MKLMLMWYFLHRLQKLVDYNGMIGEFSDGGLLSVIVYYVYSMWTVFDIDGGAADT